MSEQESDSELIARQHARAAHFGPKGGSPPGLALTILPADLARLCDLAQLGLAARECDLEQLTHWQQRAEQAERQLAEAQARIAELEQLLFQAKETVRNAD